MLEYDWSLSAPFNSEGLVVQEGQGVLEDLEGQGDLALPEALAALEAPVTLAVVSGLELPGVLPEALQGALFAGASWVPAEAWVPATARVASVAPVQVLLLKSGE
jgi:hypothetical protein